jgi:hypothetical protein
VLALIASFLALIGVVTTLVVTTTPAFAYACSGQRSCTDPTTGCNQTSFQPVSSVYVPGEGSIFLYFSNYCSTIWGATYPANPFTGNTLDARVNNAGEDTLGLPLPNGVPLPYDSYNNTADTYQLNDINVCGFSMGYNGSGWYATACY